MKKIDLAYIAGLMDGEAYIGIKKSHPYKNLTGRVNPGYHERIQIRMVDEAAILFIAKTMGGWHFREKAHCNNGRPLYCYEASDQKATNILKQLLPYLRVKKESAKTTLKLRGLKNKQGHGEEIVIQTNQTRWGKPAKFRRYRFSERQIKEREQLWLQCKQLNKVGI